MMQLFCPWASMLMIAALFATPASAQQIEESSAEKMGKVTVLNVHGEEGAVSDSDMEQTRGKVTKGVMLVSSAVCIISSVMAYGAMADADAAYDRYLHAGDPGAMDRHFRRAALYDRRAGVFLGVFEVSFLTSVFTFFATLEK